MEYDIALIRPEMRSEEVMPRGRELGPEGRRRLRKGLQTLHALEAMAVNIYKCQITAKPCPLNTVMTAAMCNEMTHLQDFQTKLYEFGFKPSKLRFRYWMAGYVFGLGSRVFGTRRILKTGIWAETKAVHHYAQLLRDVDWDAETRPIVEKDQADEQGHIERWREWLANPEGIC